MGDARDNPTDFIGELGPLAFASRLKRLQDRLFRDVSAIYGQQDVVFEPRWFLVFYCILKSGPVPITTIAGALDVSHAAVNQTAGELLEAGLISEEQDTSDGRRRLLSVTPEGHKIARRLEPVWNDIASATEDVMSETGTDVLSVLQAMEGALDDLSISDRVTRTGILREHPAIQIVDYHPDYNQAFHDLNMEWLRMYFTVEPEDRRMLNNPYREIIDPGGAILFARLSDQIAGTSALIRHSDDRMELAKMAVARPYRGIGVGEAVGRAVIERARDLGASSLFLLTSEKLQPAIRLYRRLGFRKSRTMAPEAGHYNRCTFSMEMTLRPDLVRQVSGRMES